ncbi:MAG: ATP-dependent RNA helicase dbp6 [Vezdaea aestivalis]|nr:MAG: ATP-dependent RNA helicase dbp6 [Vezdaea aestivalis]
METPMYSRYIPPAVNSSQTTSKVLGRKRKRVVAESLKSSSDLPYTKLSQRAESKKKSRAANEIPVRGKHQKPAGHLTPNGAKTRSGSPLLEKELTETPRAKKLSTEDRTSTEFSVGQAEILANSPKTHPTSSQISANETQIRPKGEQAALERFKASTKRISKAVANVTPTPHPTELRGLEPIPQPDASTTHRRPLADSKPPWIANPLVANSDHKLPFVDFVLAEQLLINLKANDFVLATSIQSTVLPLLLPGPSHHNGDVCISAATGSGKTLAYVLPIIESLRNKALPELHALIVVPTKELVLQVKKAFDQFAARCSLRVQTAVGNRPVNEEKRLILTLREEESRFLLRDNVEDATVLGSRCDVLICTPGRLIDHIELSPPLILHRLQWLVVDEADRLLDESYQSWVRILMTYIYRQRPFEELNANEKAYLHWKGRQRPVEITKVILSATLTQDPQKLDSLRLVRPKLVTLDSTSRFLLPATLEERFVSVGGGSEKPRYLQSLLGALMNKTVGQNTLSGSSSIDIKSSLNSRKTTFEGKFRDQLNPSASVSSESSSSTTSAETSSSDGSSTSSDDQSSESSSAPSDCNTSEETSSDDDSSSDSSSSDDLSSDETSSRSERMPPSAAPQNPESHGVLIFCGSTSSALRLERLLCLLLPELMSKIASITSSHGNKRRKILNAFQERRKTIIVATDVLAHGLDIPNLAHVINYDIPTSIEDYVHRCGRTARAGKGGMAWTLVAKAERRWLKSHIIGGSSIQSGRKIERPEIHLVDGEKEAYEVAMSKLSREASGT